MVWPKESTLNRMPIYSCRYDIREHLTTGGVHEHRCLSENCLSLILKGFYEEVATPLLLNVQLSYTGVSNLTQSNFSQYYNGTEIVVAGQISDNDLETLTGTITARSVRTLLFIQYLFILNIIFWKCSKMLTFSYDLQYNISFTHHKFVWCYVCIQTN